MRHTRIGIVFIVGILAYWGYRFLATNWAKIVALVDIPHTTAITISEGWVIWPFTISRVWDVLLLSSFVLIIGFRDWVESHHDKPPVGLNVLGGPFFGILIGFLLGQLEEPKDPIWIGLILVSGIGLVLIVAASLSSGRYQVMSVVGGYVPGLAYGYGLVHGYVPGLVVTLLTLNLMFLVGGPLLAIMAIVMRFQQAPAAAAVRTPRPVVVEGTLTS